MIPPRLSGRVAWIFREDHYDIDRIVGVGNIKLQDPAELAAFAMQQYDKDFAASVKPGDFLVAGHNFGYGHPHYAAMKAMRHLGIAAVIGESFFPPYRRGEINMGFPQVTCPGILGVIDRWDRLTIDFTAGLIRTEAGTDLPIIPLSAREQQILNAGGHSRWLKQELT